ncbi:MAG: polysaccharide deacetylase family protein [Burkholderiaceae bacterium]
MSKRLLLWGLLAVWLAPSPALASQACSRGTVYLTLDTGNMSQAEYIAGVLSRHAVKATFFVADERTPLGDRSLGAAWAPYWKARVAEGHAFGSHTLDHVYFREALPDGRVKVRPEFGEQAGRSLIWDDAATCREIDRADTRFRELTGQTLDRFWRAPGGRAPASVMRAARACGWAHVHWAPAGFLGDELPSETFPNDRLLQQALRGIRAGDILMAHLGIWSRRDPWAPMLDPLISGLKARGFCFATLREHPDYR